MLNKLMSSLGLQGIQVDTRLHNPQLQAGQVLNGEVIFKGAASNKTINGIYLKLMTTAEVESNDSEFNTNLSIAEWHISGAFELLAQQMHTFPFSIQLPLETPLTDLACRMNKTQVWLHTHLDVDWGLDATDKDFLQIRPTPVMHAFIQAMQDCGFHLVSADVEKGQLRGNGFYSSLGCYQELEFKPAQFFSGINEVEVSFVAEQHQTHVLLEVDRKFRGDGFKSLSIPHQHANPTTLTQQIRHLLGL